jgi:CotH kinase protein
MDDGSRRMSRIINIQTIPGFNYKQNNLLKRKRYLWGVLKFLFCLLLFFPVVKFSLDYLANTPRERATAKYTYWQRVKHGFYFNLSILQSVLTAQQEDPLNTKLPVFEIYIPRDRLDALTQNLPQSGRIYQPGRFKVRIRNGKDLFYKAQVRFRGDSVNHWAFSQRSWRIKLRKNDKFNGMRYFNLYLPRSKNQITDFLGYQVAEAMGGLLVPQAFPAHFRLNRKFDGMRVFLEQVNQDFLKNRGIESSKIFIGDIDFNDIYGTVPRDQLFSSSKGWEVVTATKEAPSNSSEIEVLIKTLDLVRDNPKLFKEQIVKVLDVSAMLRYMAFLEIVGSIHIDETHNQKLYLDNSTNLLKPIVWDPVPYYWGFRKNIDLAPNRLFRSLLQIPEFREEKNRYIWEAINDFGSLTSQKFEEMLSHAFKDIKADVLATPYKIYTENNSLYPLSNTAWEGYISELKTINNQRNIFLNEALSRISVISSISINNLGKVLALNIGGDSGVVLEEIRIILNDKLKRKQSIVISSLSTSKIFKASLDSHIDTVVSIKIGEQLYSLRKLVNDKKLSREYANYEYKIEGLKGAYEVEVLVRNSITGEPQIIKPAPQF